MKSNLFGIAAPKQNLLRLVIIRWLLLFFILVGLAVSVFLFQLVLPYPALIAAALCIALVNIATSLRLRQTWPVTIEEFFIQILGDILGVTVLFYFCGGASNPFVSYYLVPLSIASATLPWRYTSGLTLLSISCYTLLLFYYIPVTSLEPALSSAQETISQGMPSGHVHDASQKINPHILGMWFNFIMSAGLITFFVVRMSQALKLQQQKLNDYREENLRDEQVLAVATLAAGTAHELGSPLTTMKLLLNEMVHDVSTQDYFSSEVITNIKKDLGVLSNQVDLCSNTLKDLVKRAEYGQEHVGEEILIYEYCHHIVDRWKLLRPDARAKISIQESGRDKKVAFHSTVEQAILNLLNNAADACRVEVVVDMRWTRDTLAVTIRDDGNGISPEIKQQIGQPYTSDKQKGLGLGMFLSNATISRYGGTLLISDEAPRGTRLEIRLPFSK
ncbi:MAG: ATP-binding protein [Cellvibrionaceae bacterium]